METRLREAMREGLEAWEYYIVICLWTVAHALTVAQEFLVCFAGSCQRYNTACFLSNTAFRTPDGSFRAVQHLGIGDEVRLTTEQLARITHATKLPRTIQDFTAWLIFSRKYWLARFLNWPWHAAPWQVPILLKLCAVYCVNSLAPLGRVVTVAAA